MNPIPLAAPDGQIYAYACSHCRHVGGGSSLLCPPESNGPHPQLVRSSLADATGCCICRTCHAVIELEVWSGMWCMSCQHDRDAERMWGNIATAMINGIKTAEAWARFFDYEEDDRHDEIPSDDRAHDLPLEA